MATSAVTLVNTYSQQLGTGGVDWSADTFKAVFIAAANAPSAASTFGTLTPIATANGYPAGGLTLDNVTPTLVGNQYRIAIDPEVFTASGGSVTFRYVAIVDSTTSVLVGYGDYGADVTIGDGEDFNITFATIAFSITPA